MLTRRTILGATPAAIASTAGPAYADADIVAESLALLDTRTHLRTGGSGDSAVADHVRATLRRHNYRVSAQRLEAPSFEARRAHLGWDGGEVAIEPQAPVRATNSAGIRAPLRLWRDATDTAHVSGAIVVALLPPGRHSQLLAEPSRSIVTQIASAGAAAIVLITDGPTGETILLNAPINPSDAPNVPIAVLGPKPGADAIAAARAGGDGVFVMEGELRRVRSANIWGTLDRGAPYVVVSTPRTAWTPAVAERGPGFAAFNALAAWAPAALPGHNLLFVSTTAHEYDNAGSHDFFERHAPAPDRVALWLHLGAGFAARDFHEVGRFALAPLPSPDAQRFLLGSDALVPMLRETFAGQAGLECAYPTSAGAGGELNEVLARGYAPAFGLFAAHRYHHVAQDRLDKTDPRWIHAAIDALKTSILRALN
ncbi:MAG: hypothetical protein J0L81_16890 [Caulobacterales bacterium]|jgi:hypothetical protein|nr:hypothetical protein [Caulobacterales bacterium]